MNIKQQKQIQRFLIDEFGEDRGQFLFEEQEKRLDLLVKNVKNKTKNQRKMLVQTILPRIALYKGLKENDFVEAEVYEYVRKYMLEIVAAKKHSSTEKMEVVPGFYRIYSRVFLKIMRTTDLQESTQREEKDSYDITITKCLWHTACVENGCEDLCRLFCDVDDVTYGGLKKIGFTRTTTLGYGGTCCDFHFYKK